MGHEYGTPVRTCQITSMVEKQSESPQASSGNGRLLPASKRTYSQMDTSTHPEGLLSKESPAKRARDVRVSRTLVAYEQLPETLHFQEQEHKHNVPPRTSTSYLPEFCYSSEYHLVTQREQAAYGQSNFRSTIDPIPAQTDTNQARSISQVWMAQNTCEAPFYFTPTRESPGNQHSYIQDFSSFPDTRASSLSLIHAISTPAAYGEYGFNRIR